MNTQRFSSWDWSKSGTLISGILTFALIVFLTGCDLREVVEIENPSWDAPSAEANGYLGYDEADVKLTVCGNCHVDQQQKWQTTAHSVAWVSLQESGHSQVFCESCHTVSENGNFAEEPVGWSSTADERYHDVQCESCHGGGETHSSAPSSTQPVASVDLGDLEDLSAAASCAECHQGTHHPFVEEWSKSAHANVVSYAAGRASCAGCHQGQAAIERFGEPGEYIEKTAEAHLPTTCVVCHDPHGSDNEGQLRLPVKTISLEVNLCAQCHNRRTVPDPNSSHGLHPHAPEVALMVGEAGWFPPGLSFNTGDIVATHGSVGNVNGCASCHVSGFTVNDEATGEFVFQATGHTFQALPCIGVDGIPTGEDDCGLALAERAYSGCSVSGCHSSEAAARGALESATSTIEAYADLLHEQLEIVDPNGEDEGGEIDARNPTFTVAEGALFNHSLAEFGGDVYGSTVHNPFLIEALLIASIDAVEDTYGVSPPSKAGTDWDAELEQLLNRVPVGLVAPTPVYYDESETGSFLRALGGR